jgi:hypothetical protein
MEKNHRYYYCSIFLSLFLLLSLTQARRLTAQEGYPPQPDATPTLAVPYPPTQADQIVATAVPVPIGATEPAVDSTAASGTRLNIQPANPQANLGRYFLWGGFLAATFILVTAVYGATTLFVRRKD